MGRQKSKSLTIPIEMICPPPLLKILEAIQEPIEPEIEANDAQMMLLELADEDWKIYAMWIVYERFPVIDIRRYPYNTRKFQSRRSKAQILNSQIEVCKQIFETYNLLYISPLHYWHELMRERKQSEINSVFRKPLPKFGVNLQRGTETIYQPGYLDSWRTLLYRLRDERVVPEVLQLFPLHYKFFKEALKLAWKMPQSRNAKKFRDKTWNPYLEAIAHYIEDVEDNPNLKVIYEDNGNLYRNERGKPRLQPYKR